MPADVTQISEGVAAIPALDASVLMARSSEIGFDRNCSNWRPSREPVVRDVEDVGGRASRIWWSRAPPRLT